MRSETTGGVAYSRNGAIRPATRPPVMFPGVIHRRESMRRARRPNISCLKPAPPTKARAEFSANLGDDCILPPRHLLLTDSVHANSKSAHELSPLTTCLTILSIDAPTERPQTSGRARLDGGGHYTSLASARNDFPHKRARSHPNFHRHFPRRRQSQK